MIHNSRRAYTMAAATMMAAMSFPTVQRANELAKQMPVVIGARSRLPGTKFNNGDPNSKECQRRQKQLAKKAKR